MKKIFREEHGDVTASRNNFAIVYHAFGQYNEAGKSTTTRHLSSRKRYSVRSIVTPQQVNYNKLGSVYEALGHYNEAKECQEKALIMRKNIFGEEHGDIALSYTNFGIVYQALGQYSEAK